MNGVKKERKKERDGTLFDDIPEGLSVIRILCHWFTIIPALARPIVDGEREVMGGDRARDGRSTRFDGVHRITGRRVF